MSSPGNISRRKMFASLLRPMRSLGGLAEETSSKPCSTVVSDETAQPQAGNKKAIIQGRFCLAYQKSFCSVCSERCPEEGAIVVEMGVPKVVADACTGCGICNDVCPAPKNAVLMLEKRS